MSAITTTLAAALFALPLASVGAVRAQQPAAKSAPQCLHGSGETADQAARRRDALTATRTINNIQANRPEARDHHYLRQDELAGAPFATSARNASDSVVGRLSLNPTEDILPGWRLTLDLTETGYWFMIKDKTDPCSFAYISNQNGVIFTSEPIR